MRGGIVQRGDCDLGVGAVRKTEPGDKCTGVEEKRINIRKKICLSTGSGL